MPLEKSLYLCSVKHISINQCHQTMEKKLFHIDSIETYNRENGFETFHPLVAVVDMGKSTSDMRIYYDDVIYQYDVYALFLKQFHCCELFYGRRPYDYAEGTVTSFAPGQTVTSRVIPDVPYEATGLLFHPDLIRGTSLGEEIKKFSFFSYESNEALHLSEQERMVFANCLSRIQQEIQRPIDRHSRRIICQNIELLLDYCLRFYDRQFITREQENADVVLRFNQALDNVFDGHSLFLKGIPGVKYFAEQCFLSPNYFGDLIKRETGRTPQEYIHDRIIDRAKDVLASTNDTIAAIADRLGFAYPQHFVRLFKQKTTMTPTEYRNKQAM